MPSGSWRAVVSSIDPRTGKRVRQSKTDPDKAVVVRWAASHAGKPVAPGDTFDQWFTAWLEIQRASRRVIWLRTSTRKVREFIGAGGMGKFQPDPSR